MCGLPLSEKPDIRVPVYWITHCQGSFQKVCKKWEKRIGHKFTPETMVYGSQMSDKPDFQPPSDSISRCI